MLIRLLFLDSNTTSGDQGVVDVRIKQQTIG